MTPLRSRCVRALATAAAATADAVPLLTPAPADAWGVRAGFSVRARPFFAPRPFFGPRVFVAPGPVFFR